MDEDAKMIRATNGANWAKRADDNDLKELNALSDLLKGLDVETRQDTNEDGKYLVWFPANERVLEPTGRALEPFEKALKPAGRALDQIGRTLDPTAWT